MTASRTEPERVGRYRLIERIGEGGMGVVHLAVDPDGGLVAVKTLRPWLVGGHDGRRRLEREVATMRRVRGHRVAEVLDADLGADRPYIVTRYVRGPGLDKVVADHGPLRGDALTRLASGLAEGVAAVHDAQLVHRDIKPGNVLLTDHGPVLIDFGLAKVLDETRLTATGLLIGTPGYLAPEVVAGGDARPATDVHGWAATVAFAATGRPPYGPGPDAVVLDRIRRGEADLDGVPADLAPVLRRALSTDPERRPAINEVRSALGTSGPGSAAETVAAPPPAQPRPGPPADTARTAPVAPQPPAAAPPHPTRVDTTDVPRRSPEPTPRGPAKPLRTWPARIAVALGGLALLLLFGVAPVVGALVLLLVLVIARSAWRGRRELYERQVSRGYQPRDNLVVALTTPLYLVLSVPASLLQVLFAGGAGLVVGAALNLTDLAGLRLPYLAGGAVALLLAWLGPGSGRARRGLRVLTRPVDRDIRVAWVVLAILTVLCWVLLLVWDSYGTSWAPLEGLPNPLDLLDGVGENIPSL